MSRARREHLKRAYKLTEDDYRERLINQYFKCGICEEKILFCGELEVDHCHKTGRIRGLICHRCNCALARFEKGKIYTCHLADYKVRFTNYLNSKTVVVSKFEQSAVRIMRNYRANWNSFR